jgi:hypothetical protein
MTAGKPEEKLLNHKKKHNAGAPSPWCPLSTPPPFSLKYLQNIGREMEFRREI